MLNTDDDIYLYVSSWCLDWSGYNEADLVPHELVSKIYSRFIELWLRKDLKSQIKRGVTWGLSSCCMLDLRNENYINIPKLQDWIESEFNNPKTDFSDSAALLLGILLKIWSNEENIKRIKSVQKFKIMKGLDIFKFLKDCGYDKSLFDEKLAS